jgi:hypothetical protein
LILNIYRQPGTDLIIDYVIKLVSSLRYIVESDFNIYYNFFKPGINTFLCEGKLVEWSIDTIIDFIREVRTLT